MAFKGHHYYHIFYTLVFGISKTSVTGKKSSTHVTIMLVILVTGNNMKVSPVNLKTKI